MTIRPGWFRRAALACSALAAVEGVAFVVGYPPGASWLSAVGAMCGLVVAGIGWLFARTGAGGHPQGEGGGADASSE